MNEWVKFTIRILEAKIGDDPLLGNTCLLGRSKHWVEAIKKVTLSSFTIYFKTRGKNP